MPMFVWEPRYSVGNTAIDQQHEHFFELIDRLDRSLMSGDPRAMKRTTLDCIDALAEYAAVHFADEEGYMARIDYPDLALHQSEHAQLVRRIRGFRDDVHAGRLVLGSELGKTMGDWITGHILGSDMKYAEFGGKTTEG
jgi:hemerythrin